jgi:hypothetical protein
MSESKTPRSGGGCFSKLLFLILFGMTAALGTAVYFAVQPQDLTDLGGYSLVSKIAPVRDVKLILKNAVDKAATNRGYSVTFSEADLNDWLARTVVAKQGGLLGAGITLDRVWVRLEEGRAELIMARTIMGRPFTVSMYLQVEKMEDGIGPYLSIQPDGGPYHKDFPRPPRGGRFGKLVVPQGFLYLLRPAYQKLGALFPEESELFARMSKVKIEKGSLTVDSRESLGQQGMPANF